MIHSFSCKNFYSFNNPVVVNFIVNDKAPNNYGYAKADSGVRLSKIETVIGPNASGKTNILKVLPFLKWLIVDSFDTNPTSPIPVKPFMFHNKKTEPVELSADFEISGNIYTYSFILTEKQILNEELLIKNKSTQKLTSKKVFSRQWNNQTKKYELYDKIFNLPKEIPLRSNASIISAAIRYLHKGSQDILSFWQKVETNVVEAGWAGDRLIPNATQQLFEALDFYINNELIKKETEKLLSRFDFGLSKLDITREKTDDSVTIIKARAIHSINGEDYNLNLKYESSGTKQLLTILKSLLSALANGGIAVIDEFDVNLHPEIVIELFGLFIQPETNPKNAQLLFSTHSHRILNSLDKYQIILVEKNSEGESESWRLDNMTGIRADDNYYTKYIAGAYGALPKI